MAVEIIQGDALEQLRTLPSDHFHCVVTSPPYWGLRDYGTGTWEGGDPACDHKARVVRERPDLVAGNGKSKGCLSWAERDDSGAYKDACGKCGARRIDQQIGLESAPSCGRQGLMRLRSDLTEAQREYVVRRLVEAAARDASRRGTDGKG